MTKKVTPTTSSERRLGLLHWDPSCALSLSAVLVRDEQELPKQVDISNNTKAVQIQLLYDRMTF